MKVMQSVYNCQGTHKKLRLIHEFELYKFELDKFDCITSFNWHIILQVFSKIRINQTDNICVT